MTKHYIFYREDNDFSNILTDTNIKKFIRERIQWPNYLIIGLVENEEQLKLASYITIKYGDDMRDQLVSDRSPIPGVDYMQQRDPSKFKKET